MTSAVVNSDDVNKNPVAIESPGSDANRAEQGSTGKVTLDDKYVQATGRVFMNANQALVRLPLDQARRDKAAGLNSACYISGYRGSPLGVYDSALWGAQNLLDSHNIVFQPGLNEELAISAIRGTQELEWFGESKYDGVFGLWYGKGIGVDRACESMKLGNLEGASATGGFVIVAGDDHGGKSSDSAHQSENTLMAAFVPILYPATISEIIEFGLFGWAMSRYSGCYVGLKTITDTLDLSACVELPDPYRTYNTPTDVIIPPEGLNLRPNLPPLVEEASLVNYRLPAATAFARANGIDKVILDSEQRNLSIVTAGKAYLDVRQALADLDLDDDKCRQLGIRLYKPGLIWPMDKVGLNQFAEGSKAVLVVEEKRPVMEEQIARHLYSVSSHLRPALAGKDDLQGNALLPSVGELTVGKVREAIKVLLDQLGVADANAIARYANYNELEARGITLGSNVNRPAYFCSGCPHNTSTKLPEGSKAMGGIGCHGLAAVVMDRDTMQFMPMGHEGSPWVSVSQFVDTKHMFQNMGDGTYSHSGVLGIRAAVAAKVNITFKVLYNDAVAMTGGQPVEQLITPVDMVNQLLSEGVRPVYLVSDEPDQYHQIKLPENARVFHRDELDRLQKELRDSPGVSGIVYEQTCATEKRRRRKRGLMTDPDKRLFINPEVCEGCGDCSVQSNCISITPLETEMGRKRKIDQSTCNKDYSCVKGFCPSFVTVEGAKIATHIHGDAKRLDALLDSLPQPAQVSLDHSGFNILVAGIGGTGVLTVGALLGMASHLDGKGCTILDLTGMAQKGGAVTSHIRIGPDPKGIFTSRLSEGMTDILIACDMIVGSGAPVLKTLRPGTSTAILNTDVAPTGDFQSNKYLDLGEARLRSSIHKALDGGRCYDLNASKLATDLTGDSIGTNMLMLGYAIQKGLLPLSVESIQQAIRLNGTFVEGNLRTLALGRLAAHDPVALAKELDDTPSLPPLDTVEDVLASRTRLLSEYQNEAYAQHYSAYIGAVREKIAGLKLNQMFDQEQEFTRQTALTLAKLMAYKDEYEVARLYTHPTFMQRIKQQFSGDFKLTLNLAPPIIPGQDKATGRPKKRSFGPWMLKAFKLLSKLKGLRGTPFDIFGYFPERKMERRLIVEYRELIDSVIGNLNEDNIEIGIKIAAAAREIGGYGPVKEESVQRYHAELKNWLQAFNDPVAAYPSQEKLKVRQL
ncbi:indolepyruvate ferredoxin oxidoreductase family protein [Ketobacter sp. MCCC 1A13808]|uniref:indolepyruvate ferredoxin oxidoreductase family protein n=1 Tax=Ketobacter sp. MCCC 1A13808 TaxID=2602738 RepID=UPI0012EB88EC|nr:indolepyruvate ferredoxin oxidoreductase family protein [Ketobacter sp. MCCC 1A13808]MVF13474.1 indolepyruvate ferredoxin oxidoreductase family protein [Ketobacter sp. MCCC 1A13808]